MGRTPQESFQIERRRQQVSQLYLHGWPQAQIARHLGVAQSTVSTDLKVIRRQWRSSAIRDFDESVGIELARIDALERETWAAWEHSKKPAESTKVVNRGSDKHAEKTTRYQSGDPRFLEVVHKCIGSRRALLGLDAPTRIAPTSPDGDQSYHVHVMSELMRLAEEAKDGPVVVDTQFVESEVNRLVSKKPSEEN